MTTPQLLVEAFGHLKQHETPAIGGVTRALRMLAPEHRPLVAEIGDAAISERELGRHGSTTKVYDEYQVPKEMRPAADQILDAVEADDLAVSLQRRVGTDADRPPPDLTSRDFVEAAYELHTGDQRHG